MSQTTIIIFLSIALGLVILVAAFFIYNLLSQIEQLEKAIQERENKMYNVYTFMLGLVTNTLTEFKRIDRLGAFESDDDVGHSFKLLFEAIQQLKFQIEKISNPDEDE